VFGRRVEKAKLPRIRFHDFWHTHVAQKRLRCIGRATWSPVILSSVSGSTLSPTSSNLHDIRRGASL
jgi:hypothetical protein